MIESSEYEKSPKWKDFQITPYSEELDAMILEIAKKSLKDREDKLKERDVQNLSKDELETKYGFEAHHRKLRRFFAKNVEYDKEAMEQLKLTNKTLMKNVFEKYIEDHGTKKVENWPVVFEEVRKIVRDELRLSIPELPEIWQNQDELWQTQTKTNKEKFRDETKLISTTYGGGGSDNNSRLLALYNTIVHNYKNTNGHDYRGSVQHQLNRAEKSYDYEIRRKDHKRAMNTITHKGGDRSR